MNVASVTDDGFPIRCEVCGTSSIVNVSRPPGDSVCPSCGTFLWVHAVAEVTSRYRWVPDVRLGWIKATSRDEAIRQIVNAMVAELDLPVHRMDEICTAVLKREELGSTACGRGVALPHASFDWIERNVTALAFLPIGIDFQALDGEPVNTVALLLSSRSNPGEHLRVLDRIWRATLFIGSATL